MDQTLLLDLPKSSWALGNCRCLWEYNGSNWRSETTHFVSDSNKENWKKALCAFLVLDSLGTNNKMEATFLASTPPSSVRYWAVNLQNAMEVSRKP